MAKLIGADRADYLFVADSGPGEQNAQGLIVPRFGKNPEQHVAVSLSWRQVNQLLLTTREHYAAWLSAKYSAQWAQINAPHPSAGQQDGGENAQGSAAQARQPSPPASRLRLRRRLPRRGQVRPDLPMPLAVFMAWKMAVSAPMTRECFDAILIASGPMESVRPRRRGMKREP